MTYRVLLTILVITPELQVHCMTSPAAAEEDKVLYVRPDNGTNSSCPGLPCETLDYYANVSHCNNTQFILMPGLHTLSANFSLSYLENIAFMGGNDIMDKGSTGVAEVWCNGKAGFVFENVHFLELKHFSTFHCGQQLLPDSIFNCYEENHPCQAAVALKDIYSLTMQTLNVYMSHGYGVVAEGLYGNSTIEECTFTENTGKKRAICGW